MENKNQKLSKVLAVTIVIASFSIAINVRTYAKPYLDKVLGKNNVETSQSTNLEDIVLPVKGIELPVSWGTLGSEMVKAGVIDSQKFESLYISKGGMPSELRRILSGENSGKIVINRENAQYVLNLLWAFGLGNKTEVLSSGPMMNPRFGGAERMASTAGWTMARGNGMDHLSSHSFLPLTKEQEDLVARVAANIYRPCCDNPTIFPDCNHGMAMLGLLELLVSAGVAENEMYDIALQVNSFWFPENYLTIAEYFRAKGVEWKDVVAKDILSYTYSSNSGYANLLKSQQPIETDSSPSCGV